MPVRKLLFLKRGKKKPLVKIFPLYFLAYQTLGRQGLVLTFVAVGNDRRASVVTVSALEAAV